MSKKSSPNTTGFYRQGDIGFMPANAKPKGKCKFIHTGIIATGEATGHAHKLVVGPGVDLFEDEMGIMWIHIEEGGKGIVVHEEHKTITLPEGDWMVKRQREYRPTGISNVID